MPDNTLMKNSKLPLDLILIFLILALGIGIAGYRYYEKQENLFKENRKNEISAIADMKVDQIVNWRNERLRNSGFISDSPAFADQVQHFLDNPTIPGYRQAVLAWMTSLQNNYKYESVLLLDGQGKVCLSVPEKSEMLGSQARALAEAAAKQKKTVLSDFYQSDTADTTRISLLVPLQIQQDGNVNTVGVLLIRVNPYQFLYPLIQSWPTSNQTAESTLIRREGQEFICLNGLRYQKDPALSLCFLDGMEQLSAAAAERRKETVEGFDYRGKPVLAAVRQIPESSWYLATKIDAEEIYEPVRERAWSTAMLSVVLILLTGSVVVFIRRQQQVRFFRKQYEAELERQAVSRHYEYLTRYANDIILLIDWGMNIIEANDRAVLSYGYSHGELLQLKIKHLRSVAARPGLVTQTGRVDKQDGMVYETVHQRKDGTTFPVEVSSRMIEIEGKKFNQAIIRDITERKRLEDALRQSEEHFRSLIENALDIITILDGDGKILYESPSVKRILGYSQDELLGRSVLAFIHPEDAPAVVEALNQTAQNSEIAHRLELRFQDKDGSWRVLECLSNNLLNNPAATGIVINSRDVTERKELVEKIKKLNEELEQQVFDRTKQLEAANKELEAFSYSVSHDLRAPLRSADGFSQALLEDYYDQLDEQARDYLCRIRSASQRMGQLIDDLLNLSRVTRSEMYQEEVNLSALALEITEELKQFKPERPVEFVIAPDKKAIGDARLLRIVLENLLGNAWKFTGKQPRARIEFGETVHEGQRVYFVSDNGAGFDMAYVDKLFGAFQRLHGMYEFPGTGIGLATVQRIIHRHGGKVWAEGYEEKSATFYFTLKP